MFKADVECLSFRLRTPDLGYSFDSNSGRAFNYFSYGVACSEVEIDCLTGAHKVGTNSELETQLKQEMMV